MKMASLKQKYSDMDKPSDASSDEYYPSLYLDGPQIKAMGVGSADVGTEMVMTATVRVSSINKSKSGQSSMSLEIIEAAIKPKSDEPDAASVLFPNG